MTQNSQKLTADSRRFTQMAQKEFPLRISPQRRPSTGLGTLSLSKGKGRRELIFCLSGDDDKQKPFPIRFVSFCPIVVSRLGKKGFPQRTLRLCGEISDSLSARIGENLRLKILCTLRLGAKNFFEGVLFNILSVRIQPGVL